MKAKFLEIDGELHIEIEADAHSKITKKATDAHKEQFKRAWSDFAGDEKPVKKSKAKKSTAKKVKAKG